MSLPVIWLRVDSGSAGLGAAGISYQGAALGGVCGEPVTPSREGDPQVHEVHSPENNSVGDGGGNGATTSPGGFILNEEERQP